MDLLNETVLLKTKSTLFNLFISENSQFLCYEKLLNMTYVAYKNALFREMQFWSHCYTVISYKVLFRLSEYKIAAVYLSGAKNVCFCTIRDFGSPTKKTHRDFGGGSKDKTFFFLKSIMLKIRMECIAH